MPGQFNVAERIFKESSDKLRKFTVHNIYIEPLICLPRNCQGIIYVQLKVGFRIFATVWLSLAIALLSHRRGTLSSLWTVVIISPPLAKERCHYFFTVFSFLAAVLITSSMTAFFEMKTKTFKDGHAE